MAQISKKFVDLNPTLARNPITGDVATLKNDAAVKQSIKNIVTTARFERPFLPVSGSNSTLSLFETFDGTTDATIEASLSDAIRAYEPRVELVTIRVNSDIDSNSISIDINYSIIGIPLDIQSLNLILERV
jgi:phage baseplate assembly protein W